MTRTDKETLGQMLFGAALVFVPFGVAMCLGAYDAKGPQECHTQQAISISGHDSLYRVCVGKRLHWTRTEKHLADLD